MANEVMTIEQVLESTTVQSLGASLHLTPTQTAKANSSVFRLMADTKLSDCNTMSKIRFAYTTALLNYKNINAVAPVAYGKNIQAQIQYQGLIEDLKECEGVEDCNWVKLYKDIDYKPRVNSADCTELELPKEIKLDNPFAKLEVIGYYCYAKCKNGRTYTCVMSVEEAKEWAKKYSISYRKYLNKEAKSSIWADYFDDMAIKTCIKRVANRVLKEYPFDRLAKALELDQAVFNESGYEYADNPKEDEIRPSGTIKNIAEAVDVETTEGK